MSTRYVHTNLVARDWRALAAFYCDVFECVPVGPERDLAGPAVAAGIGVAGASLAGVHLRLPGHGAHGPTLEIYRYEPQPSAPAPSVLRPGFGHIAFAVDDVAAMRARVLRAGGGAVGEIVTTTAGPRAIEWCYVTDLEGNAVELQRG